MSTNDESLFFEMPSTPVEVSTESSKEIAYQLDQWIAIHDAEGNACRVPELCTVIFKTDGIAKCFHLGFVLEGNFYEYDSQNRTVKRRYDFSFWNAWGKGFGDTFYSPTHVMILETP